MQKDELLAILRRGEDSAHQFKVNVTNAEALAGEMVAFANTRGGMIVIGVKDSGEPTGLSRDDIDRLNQLVANTASQNVKNPVNPVTENIDLNGRLVMVVHIPDGSDKPYMDNQGVVWVKSGADKRRVTSREELRRLFQVADILHADEVPVAGTTMQDIDFEYFNSYFKRVYQEEADIEQEALERIMHNLNLASGGKLNLAGLLMFGRDPGKFKPVFIIKAVYFVGNDPSTTSYRDSIDIHGRIKMQFDSAIQFLKRNLRYTQQGRSFNTLGELEIPLIVLEELIVNALIHRDYFINAPIRMFVFDNRVEIISPGTIPNNLTVENILHGVSNIRNDILASFATKELPYRGIGTGIIRAVKAYPGITIENDIAGGQFIARIPREEI